MYNPISKKVVFGIIGVVFAFFLIIFALSFPSYSKHHLFGSELSKIVKEYDKDKFKALAQLKKDCPEGIKYIKKERKLGRNLSIFFWDWYATYSGYIYEDADEEIQPQLTGI